MVETGQGRAPVKQLWEPSLAYRFMSVAYAGDFTNESHLSDASPRAFGPCDDFGTREALLPGLSNTITFETNALKLRRWVRPDALPISSKFSVM